MIDPILDNEKLSIMRYRDDGSSLLVVFESSLVVAFDVADGSIKFATMNPQL